MYRVPLSLGADLAEWRAAARPLLAAGVAPDQVSWVEGGEPGHPGKGLPAPAAAMPIPRRFVTLAEDVVLHRERQRFALLYRLAWRLRSERGLLEVAGDALVARAEEMARAVRRDIHRMHAFVRFRRVEGPDGERFLSWFEPEHHVVAAAAPFFRDRFAGMRWSIMTPDRCVAWDGESLRFARGVARPAGPSDAELLELWRAHCAAIQDPACG